MAWYGRYGWRGYYPPTAPRPKAVKGKERKKFGLTWWGRKWVESIESMDDSQRMSRARAYARADRVYNIGIDTGRITANVQGNYGNYNVEVSFRKLDNSKADLWLSRIRDSDVLGAVLNNELPDNIQKICGINPIPTMEEAECSCPDYENACKHIGALYYVMADEIDAAPQILFVLNGLKKERIIEVLMGSGLPSSDRKKKGGTRAVLENNAKKGKTRTRKQKKEAYLHSRKNRK